jgi:iron complex outermembrane receptor protein
MTRYRMNAALLAGTILTTVSPAWAQGTPAPLSASEAIVSNDTSPGIGDIVVTAQRREERLQAVPIAITAIDSRTLEQAGIHDITRLEVLTPGLTVGQTGSDSRPALRGVNTDNSRQASADAAVAFFVDGIYQSANQQALVGFVDLARVEVQRGPQGTLYGRNSFGGNISLFSNLPTNQIEGSVRGEYGSFNRYKAQGILNAPLSDTVSVRVVGSYEKSDGYVSNLTPSGTRAEDINDAYFRGTLRWKPTDRLDVTLRGTAWIGKGAGGGAYEYKVDGILVDSTGAQNIHGTNILPINPRARQSDIASLPVAGVPVPTDPWTIAQDTPSTRDLHSYAGSAEINYDLDFANLKLLGSYSDFAATRTSDGDFTQYKVRFNLQQSSNKTTTAEAQLASKGGSPFQWVAGIYYLNTDAFEYFQQFRYTLGVFTDNIRTNFGTQSYAAYAQASYKLTDALRLTGGVRYTNDRKSTSGNDIANANLIPYSKTNFDKVTWRGALDYQVAPDKLLYASVSSGFRSGGFNTGVNIPGLQTFAPETVTAYELGTKTRWLDNTLQVNVSAFYNDFRALQVSGYDPNTNLVYTQNVGRKSAKGVELEVLIRPISAFEFGITASYLDAIFKGGSSAFDPIGAGDPGLNGRVSLVGHQAAMSPKYRIGLSASYAINLGDNVGTLTPRVQSSFASRYYLLDFNSIIERQSAYTKTDLRLTYEAPRQRFTVEGFVTNLENSAVKGGGEFGGRGAFFVGYAPPRQYGVALGMKF